MTTQHKESTEMSLRSKVATFLATSATDFPAALQMLSEDVVWINKLPEHVPFGGEYQGRDGVSQYFQLLSETFVLGSYAMDQFDFIETGNTLVIVGCERNARVLPTGKVFDLEFVWVLHFDEQGRIKYLREHNDTAAIGSAFLP